MKNKKINIKKSTKKFRLIKKKFKKFQKIQKT